MAERMRSTALRWGLCWGASVGSMACEALDADDGGAVGVDGGRPTPPMDWDAGSALQNMEAGLPRDAGCLACADARADAAELADSSVGASADATTDAATSLASTCAVKAIPDDLRARYTLPAFYSRYADAEGVPVVASSAPIDEALHRACLLVLDYVGVRADVRDALLRNKIRFAVMGEREKTVDLPEFAYLGDIDWRARGLGGVPLGVCAEENILCNRAADRWRGESICVHEFAHTMQLGGYNAADPSFERRLDAAYRSAIAAGLFANTYAGSQAAEYFAEGVQDWYDTNLQAARADGVHNAVNTRAELRSYDPALYALLTEVLPDMPRYRDCYFYGDYSADRLR